MGSAIDRMASESKGGIGNVVVGSDRYEIPDHLSLMDLSDGEWHTVRVLPGVKSIARHWITLKKKSKAGKYPTIPKPVHNWDVNSNTFDSSKKDPYSANKEKFHSREHEESTGMNITYYIQVIDREAQEDEPKKKGKKSKKEKKTGFRDSPRTAAWSPVRTIPGPKTLITLLQDTAKRNVRKTKKGKQVYDLADLKYGRDVDIMFDNKKDGANKWSVQLSDNGDPLSDEEKEYLIDNVEKALKGFQETETLDEAKAWVKDYIATKGDDDDDDDEDDDDIDDGFDDDDDDEPKKKKKKKSKDKSKKKKKSKDDLSFDSIKSKKKKKDKDKSKKKKKKK